MRPNCHKTPQSSSQLVSALILHLWLLLLHFLSRSFMTASRWLEELYWPSNSFHNSYHMKLSLWQAKALHWLSLSVPCSLRICEKSLVVSLFFSWRGMQNPMILPQRLSWDYSLLECQRSLNDFVELEAALIVTDLLLYYNISVHSSNETRFEINDDWAYGRREGEQGKTESYLMQNTLGSHHHFFAVGLHLMVLLFCLASPAI